MKLLNHQRFGWALRVAALAAVLLACILGWAKVHFGSLGAARAYFRGEVVEVSFAPSGKNGVELSGQPAAELTVAFTNNAPKAITIVGAITQCRCLEVKSLPLNLPPLSSRNLTRAMLTRNDKDSRTERKPQRVVFITDSPLMPQIVAELPEFPAPDMNHNSQD